MPRSLRQSSNENLQLAAAAFSNFARPLRGDIAASSTRSNSTDIFTNDQIADQLVSGYWGGPGTERRFNLEPGDTIIIDTSRLTQQGWIFAYQAMTLWTDVIGLNWTEGTEGAHIIFDDDASGAFASSTVSGGFIIQSNVNIGTD